MRDHKIRFDDEEKKIWEEDKTSCYIPLIFLIE